MLYRMERRNRPAATLVKEYCDKKSGKVSDARRELQRRFGGLDWNIQKKVLTAHLQACTSDRQWAYTQLLSLWDDSFTPLIDQLWQTYHEERCSWIIVNHFTEDYVKSHLEELSEGRNYFFICRRLGHDEHFPIDASRLQPMDCLSLMAHLGRSMTAEEALDMVFTIAKKECLNPRYYMLARQWPEGRVTKPSPYHVRALDRAHYYLREMGDSEDALQQFTDWCHRVAAAVQQDEEFIALLQQPLSDDRFNRQAYHLLLKHIADSLPEKIRNATLKEMSERNSSLELLANGFDLEEDLTPPAPYLSPSGEF